MISIVSKVGGTVFSRWGSGNDSVHAHTVTPHIGDYLRKATAGAVLVPWDSGSLVFKVEGCPSCHAPLRPAEVGGVVRPG